MTQTKSIQALPRADSIVPHGQAPRLWPGAYMNGKSACRAPHSSMDVAAYSSSKILLSSVSRSDATIIVDTKSSLPPPTDPCVNLFTYTPKLSTTSTFHPASVIGE